MLATGRLRHYPLAMGTITTKASDTPSQQSDADRQRRFDRETALIAQADASIAAGRLVDETEVDAWIDSIGTDHELPVPKAPR